MTRVERLLERSDAAAALAEIAKSNVRTAWTLNALSVCQMRQGNAAVALEILRGIVFTPGGFTMHTDAPTVFKTNFATALFLLGNIAGGLAALADARDETHPAVRRLREAVRRYRSGLSIWQKLNWIMGGIPETPLPMDFPPGDLI